ncbi:MAG: hemerythrin domain-containing protein [Phycisphaeraceae bacterium]
MAIPLGIQGQADFTQPIELLMDCHRRIEHFLGVLQKVAERYRDSVLDDQGRRALETALNYFRQAAPRHTADEEQSLFPRLRQCDDPAVQTAMAELDRLEADHRKAEDAHDRLDAMGRRWLEAGKLCPADHAQFTSLLLDLAATYAQHIRLEDEQVFVLAGRTLNAQALQQVGQEMRQRRIDDPGRTGSRCAQRRQQRLHAQATPA